MKRRILHIAPFNTANVPYTMVKAERKLGFESRLITLAENAFGFPEDICLDLPFLRTRGMNRIKMSVSDPARNRVGNVHEIPEVIPRKWQPAGFLEDRLIRFREFTWKNRVKNALTAVDVLKMDTIQLDGGLEFYRNGRTISTLKNAGKKIICCYTGSDLRVRGVIPEIDELSDLNVSVEFDHIYFHPNIHHVFFPFDIESVPAEYKKPHETIRIGHAPTNREAKGTDTILAVLGRLQASFPLEIILIEGLSHKEAMQRKGECDIFVDQLGDLGYGVNSLEALAMGIPVATSLVRGFAERYPEHPFVEIDDKTMESKLITYLKDSQLRKALGEKGRDWVKDFHDPLRVVRKIHELAGMG